MAEGRVKCPKCGKESLALPSDLNSALITYHCKFCGNDFQVNFFDHCPKCHINIGFVDPDSFKYEMIDIGKNAIKCAINPLSAIASYGETVVTALSNNSKECNGDGLCPKCGLRYLRCPDCSTVFHINNNSVFKDHTECPNCGITVFPGNNAKQPNKHSKAFNSFHTGQPKNQTSKSDNKPKPQTTQNNLPENIQKNHFFTGDFNRDFQICMKEMNAAVDNIDTIENLILKYCNEILKSGSDIQEGRHYYFLLAILYTEKLSQNLFLDLSSDPIDYDYKLIKRVKSYLWNGSDMSGDREIRLFRHINGIWNISLDGHKLSNYIDCFPIYKPKEKKNFLLSDEYIANLWHNHIAAAINRLLNKIDKQSAQYMEELIRWTDKYKFVGNNYKQDDALHNEWMEWIDAMAARYIIGMGTNVDYAKALKLLDITVNIGHRYQGMCNLGEMYETGLGVQKDLAIARKYYERVIKNADESNPNHKYAKERLENMYNNTQSTTNNKPAETLSPTSSVESEYVEEYKYILEDGEIGDRERRVLERLRTKLGISKERAMALESEVSAPKLTDEEQEYVDEYREMLAEGEIRDRDRRVLERLANRNNISPARACELEKLFYK